MKIKILSYPILLPFVCILRYLFSWAFYNYRNKAEINVMGYLVNNTNRVDLYGRYLDNGIYKIGNVELKGINVSKFKYYLNFLIWIWFDNRVYDNLVSSRKLYTELNNKEVDKVNRSIAKNESYDEMGLFILTKAMLSSEPNNFKRYFKGSDKKVSIFNIGYTKEVIINNTTIYTLRYR